MMSANGGILPSACKVASNESSGSVNTSANKLTDEWMLAEAADGDDVISGVSHCAASLPSVQGLVEGDEVAGCAAS
jgi:hypothetical protein